MAQPAVYVGPGEDPLVERAVERGGGRVTSAGEAEAFVWVGSGSRDIEGLHDGVRWVQLPAAGVEGWLSAGAIDGRRTFTSAAGAYASTCAEHTVALLLAGIRRLQECARATSWGGSRYFGGLLHGSTVAIVGAGGIGRAVIELLQPFGVELIAVTRSGREVPGADRSLPADRLAEVWPSADHVVIAAPATGATRHLVGTDELAAMRSHAWIVNIARGSLIDTDALVEALRDERIGGAALDVTDPEPLPDGHPLWHEPRALITPHSANPTEVARRLLADHVEENVRRFAQGRELLAVVNLDAGY